MESAAGPAGPESGADVLPSEVEAALRVVAGAIATGTAHYADVGERLFDFVAEMSDQREVPIAVNTGPGAGEYALTPDFEAFLAKFKGPSVAEVGKSLHDRKVVAAALAPYGAVKRRQHPHVARVAAQFMAREFDKAQLLFVHLAVLFAEIYKMDDGRVPHAERAREFARRAAEVPADLQKALEGYKDALGDALLADLVAVLYDDAENGPTETDGTQSFADAVAQRGAEDAAVWRSQQLLEPGYAVRYLAAHPDKHLTTVLTEKDDAAVDFIVGSLFASAAGCTLHLQVFPAVLDARLVAVGREECAVNVHEV